MNWADIRIGQGYDMRALVEGHKLILGGVGIPHTRGLFGHSDAGALLHAITDALFGAAGLGDIGRHFPDTDPAFAGADGHVLLHEAVRRVHKAGYAVSNVDATVIAQKSKLTLYAPGTMANLAEGLGIAPERCDVKAKTDEKLGFEGKEGGTVAQAVVLIYRAEGADQD